jgi:hypothetical protein
MLKKLNSPQINDPMKKWAKCFFKEEVQMPRKHIEKCTQSLAIKEMQIKDTLRFHFIPLRIATIKNTNDNKCC